MLSARVAFIGQSMGSHAFSHDFFDAAVQFCSCDGIASLSVILADQPHRYSLIAAKGMSEREAIIAVDRMALEKFRFLERIAARHSIVTIHRWTDFCDFPSFGRILNAVEAEYSKAGNLSDVINQRFLEHAQDNLNLPVVSKFALEIGVRYIIQELALMLFLYGPIGYDVQISPFPMPSFLKVSLENLHISDLTELSDLVKLRELKEHVTILDDKNVLRDLL